MAKAKDDQGEFAAMSFEDAIKELTGIVTRIERGDIALADSIDQYERGMKLLQHCRSILQQAEKRIETITKSDTAKRYRDVDIPEISEEPGKEEEELF